MRLPVIKPRRGDICIAILRCFHFPLTFFVKFVMMLGKTDKPMPNSQLITQLVVNWRQKGLSTRASYVLAKSGISEVQLASYHNFEALIRIKNCGSQTAREIWDFMKNSKIEVKEVKFEDFIPR